MMFPGAHQHILLGILLLCSDSENDFQMEVENSKLYDIRTAKKRAITTGRSIVTIMFLTASFKQIEDHRFPKLIMIVKPDKFGNLKRINLENI